MINFKYQLSLVMILLLLTSTCLSQEDILGSIFKKILSPPVGTRPASPLLIDNEYRNLMKQYDELLLKNKSVGLDTKDAEQYQIKSKQALDKKDLVTAKQYLNKAIDFLNNLPVPTNPNTQGKDNQYGDNNDSTNNINTETPSTNSFDSAMDSLSNKLVSNLFTYDTAYSYLTTNSQSTISFTVSTIQTIRISNYQKSIKIAIVDFTNINGNTTQIERIISEELTTRLGNQKEITLVERNLLKKILDEQKLSTTSLIDQENIKKIGKIYGVDALLTGTTSSFGKSFRINARVVNTETANVASTGSVSFPKSLLEE